MPSPQLPPKRSSLGSRIPFLLQLLGQVWLGFCYSLWHFLLPRSWRTPRATLSSWTIVAKLQGRMQRWMYHWRSRQRRWWRSNSPLQRIDRFFDRFRIRSSQWRKWTRLGASGFLSFLLVFTQTIFLNILFPKPAQAATTLQIETITWDFVGLDSNKPETQGPETYIVGARVCNLGTEPARNVQVQFHKDGVDNGYTFIRLTGGDTYYTEAIAADDGSEGIPVGSYVFDTRANGALAKSKYDSDLPSTPQYCQDYYYNFKVDRTPAAWNTYQRYYITAKADNASSVSTERPHQIYIEKLISQARNEVYFFGCDATGGTSYSTTATVQVGDIFTCESRAHTSTSYPQLSFTADIPNVIFQILDVQSTYSNPVGGTNNTVYADACGWVNDPRDPRYRLSPSACSSAIISSLNVYSDQYPYLAPPNEGNGGVGNDITTRYKIKVIGFPDGVQIQNPIQVSNVILDFSGSSFHYNADYGLAPNIVNITVGQPAATDLSVVKSHSGNFNYGNNTYTLTVSDAADVNNSPAKSPVTLTDTLPTDYSFVDQDSTKAGIQPLTLGGAADNWDCYTSGQVLTCLYDLDTNVGSVGNDGDGIPDNFPDNTTQVLTLNVNVPGTVASGTTSTNFVRVALNPNQTDSNTSNNTSSDPTTLLPGSDLAIVKTLTDGDTTVPGNQTSLVVGREGLYNLQVTNTGNLDAVTPTITDTLPTDLEFVSGTGTNWTCGTDPQDAQVVTCTSSTNLSYVAPNNTTSVTLRVRVRETNNTSVTNPAIVSSPTYDYNLANNSTSVNTPIVRPAPDLSISKAPSPSTLVLNKNSNFTLTVTNVGSDATSGLITVNESFPAGFGMQYVSHSGTGWSCVFTDTGTSTTRPCQSGDTTGGTQSINFYNSGPLAPAAVSTITLTVRATLDPGTTVNNTVTVSTPGDTVAGNNTATAAVNIGKPDLAITKSHLDPMVLGQNSDYTITVTNSSVAGTAATTGPITVVDTLPVGFTYQSFLGAGWLCLNSSGVSCTAGNTGTLTFYNSGPLASGGSSNFTVTVSPATYGIASATRTAGSNVVTMGTATTIGGNTAANHGFSVGDQITVAGLTDASFNGIFTIASVPTTSTFTYASGSTAGATLNNTARASGSVTRSNKVVVSTEGEASTTLADNTYNDPTTVGTSSSASRDIAVVKRLTRVSANPIALTDLTPTAITYGGVNISNVARTGGTTVTITTSAAHGFAVNDSVNVNANTNTGVDGTFTVASVPSSTTFTYTQNGGNFSSVDTGTVSFSNQCAPALPTGAGVTPFTPYPPSNSTTTSTAAADDFSGTGTTGAAINTGTVGASRIYNCPTLIAGQYVQYKIAVGSNQTSGSGRDIGIDFDDFIPPIIQNVSWSCSVPEPGIGGGGTGTGTNTTCDTSLSTLPTYPTPEVTGTGNTISLPRIALRKRGGGSSSGEIPYVLITAVGQVNPSATAADLAVVSNLAQLGSDAGTIDNNQWTVKSGTGVIPPAPDLTIAKTPATGSPATYSQYAFNLTPQNVSTGSTTGRITITDTLPSGLDFVSASGTGWTCSTSGQVVTCFSDTAIPGSTTSPNPITLTVQVNASAPVSTSRTITAASAAANVATITTSVAHGFSVGQVVTIAGVTNTAYNGTFTIASVTATTFTYNLGATPTASSGGNATNVLQNRVSVSTPGETILGNNNASAIVTITTPVLPNLTIAKTDGGATFTEGVNGTYTLTVSNSGSVVTSTPITVTDTLPTGLSYVSATGTNWTCSNTGQVVICTTSAVIANGGSAPPITVTVTPTIGTGTVTNNVRVDTTPNAETSTADNTASDTTPLQNNLVDLQIVKTTRSSDGTAAVTSFQVGQQYRYRLTVTNNTATKPAIAPISITDQLPTGLTLLYSVSSDGFTCAATGQTVTCDRPTNLPASGTASVDLVVQVSGTASGTLTNPARVTSTSDPCADFTCTNGTADNNRTSINTSVASLSDLAITKTAVDQDPDLPGDPGAPGNQFYDANPGTYTFTVTNNGPSNYTGAVLVNEDLGAITPTDPNFTYLSHSGTGWTCTQFGTANPCVVGNKNLQFSKTGLQAGESSNLTLTVNVPDGTTLNTHTNTATIDSATITAANDANSANNSDTEAVQVVDNLTTFSLEKDDDDGTGEPTTSTLQTQFVKGGVGQYTIVATNTGSVAAKAPVTISDTFPSGFTYAGYPQLADWECTGAINGPSVSCIYGEWDSGFTSFTQKDFPAGATSGVAVNVNVANATPPTTSSLSSGAYINLTTNSASLSGSNFTTVNASEDTAIIQPADLAVTKTLDTDGDGSADTDLLTANTTGVSRYSLTVQNNGPGTSYAPIYLQDYLPTGVAYGSNITLPAHWTFLGYNSQSNEVSYVYNGDLTSGANAGTIVMAVNVASNAPGSTINLVRVDGFTAEPDYDLVTAGYQDPKFAVCDRSFTTQPVNNCATVERGVSGGVSTDLEVIKLDDTPSDVNGSDDDLDSVPFNTNFTYLIRVQNNGPVAADSVNLSDSLPEGLQFVSVTIDPGDNTSTDPYGLGSNVTRVCGFDNLADRLNCNLYKVGTSESNSDPIDITVTVTPILSGTIPNTAVVTSTIAESNNANNSESESVIVTGGTGDTISGTIFIDKNNNGVYNAGTDTPDQDITVRLYRDANNDNAVDANDVLLSTTSSAADGTYSFITSLTGNFVVAVDTTDGDLPSNAIWTTVTVLDATLGSSDTGNDFGYRTPPGNVVFVKRITAINGTAITGFEDDTTSPKANEDYVDLEPAGSPDGINDVLWPTNLAQYLRGAIGDRGAAPNSVDVNVQPGQVVEYTVYFLSNGGSEVRDVKFCDLIPAKMTYVPNSMQLGYNTVTLADPTGAGTSLTDTSDGDAGTFYAGGTAAPSVCTTSNANGGDDANTSTNDTGAVFVQIEDNVAPYMPYATAAGTPAGSYGFVRFRATVD